MHYNNLRLVLGLGLVRVSSRVRVRIRVKVRVSVMVRVSIRRCWVVNFALFRCYRPIIYTRPIVGFTGNEYSAARLFCYVARIILNTKSHDSFLGVDTPQR